MNLIVNADKNWGIGKPAFSSYTKRHEDVPADDDRKSRSDGKKDIGEFSKRHASSKEDEHRPDDRSGLRRPGSHCGPQPGRIV